MFNRTILLPANLAISKKKSLYSILRSLRSKDNLISLSFQKIMALSPFSLCAMALVIDTALEQKVQLKIKRTHKLDKNFREHLKKMASSKTLPKAREWNWQSHQIHLSVMDTLDGLAIPDSVDYFQETLRLSEDMAYSIQMVANELLTNSLDHSGAERCYFAMGLDFDGNIEVSVLDDGVGIPTKMSQRYFNDQDHTLLKMAFEEGTTTRRKRTGGFGLANIKGSLGYHKGRLVIVSNGAQANLKFDTGQYKVSSLTYRSLGTWCSATFFRERK